MTCPDTHDGRTCTQPDSHPPPHRDRLGTWVHIHEYSAEEQAQMDTEHADTDQLPGQLALDLDADS